MKYCLSLLLGAVVSLGALPSTASARTVVEVETAPVAVRVHHRHSHQVFRRAHWVYRRHHRVLIPAHWVTVRY